MKRETVEAMAANIAHMLANIGKLAKLAADEIEASPQIARADDRQFSLAERTRRYAERAKKRAALVSALRTLQNNSNKED